MKSLKGQGKLNLISQWRPYDSKIDNMTETGGRTVKYRAAVRTCMLNLQLHSSLTQRLGRLTPLISSFPVYAAI